MSTSHPDEDYIEVSPPERERFGKFVPAAEYEAMQRVIEVAERVCNHVTHAGFISRTDWEQLEKLRDALDRLDATGVAEGDSDEAQR